MTEIKLPAYPEPFDEVYGIDVFSGYQLRAYATQAVREALAAQVPVAWVMQVGMRQEFLPKSKVLLATSMGYRPKPLALIPEKDHGDTP